jgi:superfamily II DNA/RNA helicase
MTSINEKDSYEFEYWDELAINTQLLRGIFTYGFEKPSPIQKKAIIPLIKRKDLIAQAQSGTGKTATFTIGALANINLSENNTQVLVLSPTIELTIQTAKVFTSIGN